MPYRRLPNTDLARLHSLQHALMRAQAQDYTDQVIPYKMQADLQRFLVPFENAVMQSKDNYVSRVIRGEIKKEQKLLYGLDPHQHIVPDLSTEENLLEWGKKIIEGEQKRMANGGFPIYNPAINKVKVHYDIFCEHRKQHAFHVQNTERVHGDLDSLRAEADRLILQIWNLVEDYYKNEFPYERLMKCQLYGVIYYYRKGEKKLTAEVDHELRRIRDSQPTIQWSSEDR